MNLIFTPKCALKEDENTGTQKGKEGWICNVRCLLHVVKIVDVLHCSVFRYQKHIRTLATGQVYVNPYFGDPIET